MTLDQRQGSAPWFVREQRGRRCQIRPASRAGWILTSLYVLAMVAASSLLMLRDPPRPIEIIAWLAIALGMTAAFVLTALRTSEPILMSAPASKANPRRDIAIALLAASAIVGASLLGLTG